MITQTAKEILLRGFWFIRHQSSRGNLLRRGGFLDFSATMLFVLLKTSGHKCAFEIRLWKHASQRIYISLRMINTRIIFDFTP